MTWTIEPATDEQPFRDALKLHVKYLPVYADGRTGAARQQCWLPLAGHGPLPGADALAAMYGDFQIRRFGPVDGRDKVLRVRVWNPATATYLDLAA